ncbi:MAG: hypothetical protein QM796_18700 [Chthoniobacteraceae bacterium]
MNPTTPPARFPSPTSKSRPLIELALHTANALALLAEAVRREPAPPPPVERLYLSQLITLHHHRLIEALENHSTNPSQPEAQP